MWNGLVGRAARTAATGLVGAAAYDGVKRIVRRGTIRRAAVVGMSWGLRGARAAETGAEKARLVTADIVSEARARNGEQAPVPGAGHGHEHEH